MLSSLKEDKYIILQERYRLLILTVTNLSFLCLNGHVITLGAGDLAFDVALQYRLLISTVTNLPFLRHNGHVITLGAGDLAFDVALLVVDNPARRFAIVVFIGFLE